VTSNSARALVLLRALRAAAERDHATIRELCTEDVAVWTPTVSARSLPELLAALDRRDGAFSELALETRPLDVGGATACVEWTLAMTHSGPIETSGDAIGPSGARVTVNGITVAEFRQDRICSLRQYWDEVAVLRQLGGSDPER
jgi:ketosteroid isomerase-like protein